MYRHRPQTHRDIAAAARQRQLLFGRFEDDRVRGDRQPAAAAADFDQGKQSSFGLKQNRLFDLGHNA
jgi:hypothetical protein